MDCLGDQRDAGYFFSRPLPVDAGEVYVVVSTLGTKTGNATYAALSVNDASMMAGVANVLDTTLEGSADDYASSVDDADKFFVHYFTNDCTVLKDVPGGMENCTPTIGVQAPVPAPLGDSSRVGRTSPGDAVVARAGHGGLNAAFVASMPHVRAGSM